MEQAIRSKSVCMTSVVDEMESFGGMRACSIHADCFSDTAVEYIVAEGDFTQQYAASVTLFDLFYGDIEHQMTYSGTNTLACLG